MKLVTTLMTLKTDRERKGEGKGKEKGTSLIILFLGRERKGGKEKGTSLIILFLGRSFVGWAILPIC